MALFQKTLLSGLIAILTLVMVVLTAGCNLAGNINDPDPLVRGFQVPPDSLHMSTYWYWISDNLSEEGVVKDLHAMKAIGINRAFIGNIGLGEQEGLGGKSIPLGKVRFLSDEWWRILHTALKTATELGIEIGIFNSPGWSQSGGPWVQPHQSMRYLTASELVVEGPLNLLQALPVPGRDFQDVRVIAYPLPDTGDREIRPDNCLVVSDDDKINGAHLIDSNPETVITFDNGQTREFHLKGERAFTLRSVSVSTAQQPSIFQIELLAFDQDDFVPVKTFTVSRYNPHPIVGFNPYGPVVEALPETTAQQYKLRITTLFPGSVLADVCLTEAIKQERYVEKSLAKMHQTPLPYWGDYLWPDQPEAHPASGILQQNQVVNITAHLGADGVLNWQVPPGRWKILRTGMLTTGVVNEPATVEATGLEIDKLSRRHVEAHFDAFLGQIIRRIPEAERKSWKVVVMDSYEKGGQNWTDDWIERFEHQYGYSPVPFIPVIKGVTVESRKASDRFLWDLRRLVADKLAYEYVAGLREVSHRHGLTIWLENYGHWGFPGEFLMYGGQADEVAGEFWAEGDLGNIENRAASSCAHIYGKNKVSAESFTSAGMAFSRHPATMKPRGDRFFAEGINNTLLCLYIHQSFPDSIVPGINAGFGNEFNRNNTWYYHTDLFVDYLKRSNYMLQQGLNVADVAYFIGEDVPKMTGITDPALPIGYQYDYINAEVVVNAMSVKDGWLTLPHGTRYRMLVLPPVKTMRPVLLQKIKQLVADGGVVLGSAPKESPSLQGQPDSDAEVRQLAAELWGTHEGAQARKFGKGLILSGMSMEEALDRIGCLPDCRLPQDGTIHYGHRQLPDADIYFLSNQTDGVRQIAPVFRVSGRQPELWHAVTGAIRQLPVFKRTSGGTEVPLLLQPYESCFIVFRHPVELSLPGGVEVNFPEPRLIEELAGPWEVRFDSLLRGPSKPVIFEALQDWSQVADERIRYYSGSATYAHSFALDQPLEGTLLLNLGDLTAMARVFVNGQLAGGAWTPPYEVDITRFVKEGVNDLRIEVVNTWVNRLIGDQKLPREERKTWCPVNDYHAQSPLQPSGLFGPVQVQQVPYASEPLSVHLVNQNGN